MSRPPLRILYFSALCVAVAGLLAGAVQALLRATAISPPVHLALAVVSWAGSTVPQALFAWSQVHSEGRQLMPLWGTREDDGWALALVASMLCSLVAFAVAGDIPRALIAVLFMSTSAAFVFVRVRQLARYRSETPKA